MLMAVRGGRRLVLRLVVIATMGLALGSLTAPTALAQPPNNDDFANATVITDLPFSTTEDTTQATFDPTDPTSCFDTNIGSVWFAFTPPSDIMIQADTFGSNYNTLLSAWTGTQGALNLVACNDNFQGQQSVVRFLATSGTTYYFMVTICCGTGGNGGGDLHFALTHLLLQPPANDDFEDATPIPSVPFSDSVNLEVATTQASESSPSCVNIQSTAWYSFTPAASEFVMANVDQFGVGLAVYTGTSLTNLTEVGCSIFFNQPVPFRAQANTTYYVQVGTWLSDVVGPVTFNLDVAPNPVALFEIFPKDPSSFDTIEFRDSSFDPLGQPIISEAWDFGGGATGTGCCPTHQYPADGDYPVGLTVTTPDGRTASTTQIVQVRTHDVAIVRIGVPKSGHVGQTITITAHVRNTRYPGRVEVALFKTVLGGFEQVGSLTQSVPVRNRTSPFPFTYTISEADRAIGKVSFKAVATILDHRDALAADNELISPPMKVT
jgi:hypothetical protein